MKTKSLVQVTKYSPACMFNLQINLHLKCSFSAGPVDDEATEDGGGEG